LARVVRVERRAHSLSEALRRFESPVDALSARPAPLRENESRAAQQHRRRLWDSRRFLRVVGERREAVHVQVTAAGGALSALGDSRIKQIEMQVVAARE
jgi:hypothetical protein